MLISTENGMVTNGKQEAILEVSDRDSADMLFRKIVSLYLHGYSLIGLRAAAGSLSSSKRDAIKDMVRRHLIGTEGVAESKDRISIHVLLGFSELSVESALKKMLLIASSMQKDAMVALEDDDKTLARGVIERDDEVDRFGLYVIRQLNVFVSQGIFKENLLEPRDLLGYTIVARILERTADHSTRIAGQVLGLIMPLQEQVVKKLLAMSDVALEHARLCHAGALQAGPRGRRPGDREGEAVRRDREDGDLDHRPEGPRVLLRHTRDRGLSGASSSTRPTSPRSS